MDSRPGYTTTEFYLTVANLLLNFIGAALALFHPGFHIAPQVQQFVLATAPLAAAVGTAFYALSRAHTKAAQIASNTAMQTHAMSLAYDEQEKQKAWDLAVAAADAKKK